MIALYIDNLPVDLPTGAPPIQLTYDVRNAQELGSVTGYGSYTVKLPASTRNELIFGSVWDYDVVDTAPKADPRRERPCILLLDGEVIIRGFALLLEWSSQEYQIQITGGNKGWGTPFKTRRLRDVNLDPTDWRNGRWLYQNNICEYVKSLGRTGVVAGDYDSPSVDIDALHNDFPLCTWPFVDWGGVTITPITTTVVFEDQRPACYVRTLLLAHFSELGYRVVSNWFASVDGGLTLAMLFNGTFPNASEQCDSNVLSVDLPSIAPPYPGGANGGFVIGGYRYAPLAITSFDALNEYRTINQAGTRYVLKPRYADICYTIEFSFTTPNNQVGDIVVQWGNVNGASGGAVLLFEDLAVATTAGVPNVYSFVFTPTPAQILQANFAIRITWIPIPGPAQVPTWNYGRLYRTTGGEFDLRDTLPDATVADLVKALTAMFNLYIWTDDNQKAIYIEPYTSFFSLSGLDITPAIDTTKAEIHSNITKSPVSRVFLYQDDDADAGLRLYQETNLSPFASYETRPEVTDKKEYQVPLFAPTICAPRSTSDIWIPTLQSSEDPPVYTTDFAPRIVRVERRGVGAITLGYGIPILNCNAVDYTNGFYNGPAWQNAVFAREPTAPLAELKRGLTFNALNDAFIGASDGLYFLFYEDEVDVLEPGRQIKARFVLGKQLTIKKLTDFRNLVVLKKHIFQIVKVDKYQPGGDDKVEVTLILRI